MSINNYDSFDDEELCFDKDHPLFAKTMGVTVEQAEEAMEILMHNEDEGATITLLHFVLREFADKNKTFTDREAFDRMKHMLASHSITRLEKRGLVETIIDENGEFVHSLTEAGKKHVEERNNDKA